MKAYLDTVNTPAGPITFAVNEEGALIRSHFEESDNHSDIEDDLRAEGYESFTQDSDRTAHLRQEISEYCAGERHEFTVPVATSGYGLADENLGGAEAHTVRRDSQLLSSSGYDRASRGGTCRRRGERL